MCLLFYNMRWYYCMEFTKKFMFGVKRQSFCLSLSSLNFLHLSIFNLIIIPCISQLLVKYFVLGVFLLLVIFKINSLYGKIF